MRNLRFTDIHSTSLYWPFFQGRPDCPFENLRFDNCEFIRLTPREMPDARRHGAVPKPSPDNFIHVKGVSMTNTAFTFTGDFSYKNDYDWTLADR